MASNFFNYIVIAVMAFVAAAAIATMVFNYQPSILSFVISNVIAFLLGAAVL